MASVLVADEVGHSCPRSVYQRATIAALDAARAMFREQIAKCNGRVVDRVADSVMSAK